MPWIILWDDMFIVLLTDAIQNIELKFYEFIVVSDLLL